MPDRPPPDQQSYWNKNLDPQNLGREKHEAVNWENEFAFYHTPDQDYALRQVRPLRGKQVLELGAGLGINAINMAAEGAHVAAVDIAHDRLVALRQRQADFVSRRSFTGKLHLVKAAAEALPFRDAAFDVVYSKSVLIHTDLDRSVAEARRVMADGGVGTFIEPMTQNAFVNLYRLWFAPKIWQSIARYFGEEELEIFRRVFRSIEVKRFYFLGFFAFVWQFALPVRVLFRVSLWNLWLVDKLLMQVPALAKRAWFAVVVVRK